MKEWDDLVRRIERFNSALASVEKLKGKDLEGQSLKPYSELRSLADYPHALHPARLWLADRVPDAVLSALDEAAEAAAAEAREVEEAQKSQLWLTLEDGGSLTGVFFSALDDYKAQFQKALKLGYGATAPERFVYKGFAITNPDDLPDSRVNALLGAVDHMLALFKKRGVEPLLYDALRGIQLMHTEPAESPGWYDSRKRLIALGDGLLGNTHTRLDLAIEWIHGTLVHEMGHHVHMNLLHPEAKALWDAPWEEVAQAKKRDQETKKLRIGVKPQDRQRYFDALVAADWNPSKAAKKFKGDDLVKVDAWLRKPKGGLNNYPFITPKQFRWTEWGLKAVAFLRDPIRALGEELGYNPDDPKDREILEREVQTNRMVRVWRARFGLDDTSTYVLDEEDVKALEANVEVSAEATKLLESLEIPTAYGHQDHQEDFADTFTLFLLAPERLSDRALFRMKQALAVSGFYGKQVMRLARAQVYRRLVCAALAQRTAIGGHNAQPR